MKFFNRNKNVGFLYKNKNVEYIKIINIDETEIPYIQINYYNTKPDFREDVVIPIYFTDFYQKEYSYNDYSLEFTIRYEVDGNVKYINNVKAGEYELNLGKLTKGMHWYSVQIIDRYGRVSRRIFNDLYVIDTDEYLIKESETYIISDEDLSTYNISKDNNKDLQSMINNRVGLTALFKDLQEQGYRKCVLPLGVYRVNRTIRLGTGDATPIDIPTNFTVDMNGSTFKLHEYNDTEYGDVAKVENLIVRMKGVFDSHLINGTIEGDYAERQVNGWISGGNGEHNNAIYTYGAEFSSLENITIKQTTGYNVCAGQDGSYGSGRLGVWVDDLCIINGEEVVKEGYVTSNIGTMDANMLLNKYIVASVWLAVGYLKGKYWDMDFHFYNEEQEFIETIKVYQFTRCRIPDNAIFFRCTFRCKSSDIGSLSIHHMKVCRYFEVNNCHWIDNRTCSAPFQAQFYAYNDCTFTRSGQSITPCEIDFEDGWEQQQDFFVRGCEILENAGSGDIIDNSGINHQMENCKNINYTARYRLNGLTIKNCEDIGVSTTIGWMTGNTIRVFNNKNIKKLTLGYTEEKFFNYQKTKVIIRDNDITISFINKGNGFYVIKNNNVTIDGTTENLSIYNCNITQKGTSAYTNGNIYVKDSIYKLADGETYSKFSFNALNVPRIYENCVYECPAQFLHHNYFNSGIWENCTFKEDIAIKPSGMTLTPSQIQFNNCIFEKNVTVTLGSQTYMQFNNCVFLGEKIFTGTSQDRVEFNDTVSNNIDYLKLNVPLMYMDINTEYKITTTTIPYNLNKTIEFSTDNSDYCSINSDGLIMCSNPSDITVSATVDGLYDSYLIKFVDVDYSYGYINSSGVLISFTNNYMDNIYRTASGNISIKSSTNIALSIIRVAEYDINYNFIKTQDITTSTNTGSCTLDSNTRYIKVGFRVTSGSEKKFPELFGTYIIENE